MSGFSFFEEQRLKFLNNKEMTKLALYYIELYRNPIHMAMKDLDSGELKDPSIIRLIGDLMDSENAHKREVLY